MRTTAIFTALLLSLASSAFAVSPAIDIVGTLPATVIVHSNKLTHASMQLATAESTANATEVKHILLQHIILSKIAQKNLDNKLNASDTLLNTPETPSVLPAQIDLGMNGVPILDQGMHGACATFASTAIIDAIYSKGDYISQLCNLELTDFLHPNSEVGHEGWEGSTNYLILSQMQLYGVISKTYQQEYGCGGLKDYPLAERENIGLPLSSDDFLLHSEKLMVSMSTKTLLNIDEAFKSNRKAAFKGIKQALLNGHRVAIGILTDHNTGSVGAFGWYKTANDSWILTPDIKKNIKAHKIDSGHAVIITAYDDNAFIKGPDQTLHKGVFTLRNSWGTGAGNHGEYYMSYHYFKTLGIEAIEVLPTPEA